MTHLFILTGWLHKEMKSGAKSTSLKLKKRWFVLTSNSLDYYKSSERNASKLGTLVLNSLCSVVQPDEKIFKDTGQFMISVVVWLLEICIIYLHFPLSSLDPVFFTQVTGT